MKINMHHFIISMFTVATLCCSTAAHAEIHTLIMAISNYQGNVPPLKGVAMDVESAKLIAKRMGAKEENIHVLRDQQLTLSGMRTAFDDLTEQIQPGDQVFVYYSGHGGRMKVHDPEERCAESLVTVDGYGFIDTEMEARVKRISEKAGKVVMFFDACHSGGVTTRGLVKEANESFTPKFWSKGGSEGCEKPVNMLTRGIRMKAAVPGSGALNYVYIAAARDNEVSLDNATKGGVATQAWLKCMTSDARDIDGSGGITAEEVRQCAQEKINITVGDSKSFLPHHISITGNENAVLKFAEDRPATQENIQTATRTPATDAAINPLASLQDIYNNRDDKRLVKLEPLKSSLKIGVDAVAFKLSSSHPGYIYLLMVGSDGKTFDILFPNKLDQHNYIDTGQILDLPRSSWEIVAQGPAGEDRLLAIVADSPRDFSKLGTMPAGPFSSVEATARATRDIEIISTNSSNASDDGCINQTAKRNLVVQHSCSNAYGAAITDIREIP